MLLDPRSMGDQSPVAVHGQDIVQVKTFRYLGVYVDSDLSWGTQVANVCAKIHQRLHFLRPKAVTNLTVAAVNTTAVQLTWVRQDDYEQGYAYQVTVQKDEKDCQPPQLTTTENYTVTDLTPGGNYTWCVVTVVGEVNSTEECITDNTRPKAVTNLTVAAVNTTAVQLTWVRQDDYKQGYSYQVTVRKDEKDCQPPQLTTTENYTVTGLTPGESYTWCVVTVVGEVNSTEECITDNTRPKAVTNLTVAAVNTTAVQLTWVRQDDYKQGYSYQVTVRKDEKDCQPPQLTTTENYTVTGLTPGESYTWCVVTVVGEVNSTEECITDNTRPKAVTNLTVAAVNTTAVQLTWVRQDDYKQGYSYQVTVRKDEKDCQPPQLTTTENYTVTGLTPGESYTWCVVTVVGEVNSTEECITDNTRPKAVTNLTVAAVNTTAVQLTWVRQDDYKQGYSYQVTVRKDEKDCQPPQLTTTENYTVTGLTPGESYTWCVVTVVGEVNSTEECITDNTRPKAVTNLTVAAVNTTAVQLTWVSQDDYKQGYSYQVIVRKDEKDCQPPQLTTTENYTVTGLTPGESYTWCVVTVVGEVNSTEECITDNTRPKAVTNLTVAAVNTTAVQLTWVRQDDYKQGYSYQVTLRVGKVYQPPQVTTTENYTVTDLTPGECYTWCVVTVVGKVKSTEECINNNTRPKAVTNLTVVAVNTTAVQLTWVSQDDYKQGYSYQVTLRVGKVYQPPQVTTTENYTVTGLTPGESYTWCVVTVVGEVNSTEECITEPDPVSELVAIGTTTNISVNWKAASGKVDYYSVLLYRKRDSQLAGNQSYLSNTTNAFFDQLNPGTLYRVQVDTKSGQLSASVEIVNATFPNPPGPLQVGSQTTDSITVSWSIPEYMHNFTVFYLNHTQSTENNSLILRNLESGTLYNISVVTVGPLGYQSTMVATRNSTKPNAVTEINATTLNTTAIFLSWPKPKEYKDTYKYRIEASNCTSRNVTVVNQEATMVELEPGTKCKFCILTSLAEDIEGEAYCTDQYTKPQQVQPTVSNEGSNNTIVVSWVAPTGNVEWYEGHLWNQSDSLQNNRSTMPTSFKFEGLLPGRKYKARVITISGPFSTPSDYITNATFPNPPGPIEILTKTISSIGIQWQDAPLMTNTPFEYVVTCIQSKHNQSYRTTGTNHTFSNLSSGTPYNISVATVGPLDLWSKTIWILVTTKPWSVNSLKATTEEEAILLTWARPMDHKTSYCYIVTWVRSDGPKNGTEHQQTHKEEHNVSSLVPGSLYNFSVITVTLDHTQSDPMDLYNCTSMSIKDPQETKHSFIFICVVVEASPVPNFTCRSSNGTNAEIVLFWTRPKGGNSGFIPRLYSEDLINKTYQLGPEACSPNCTHTVRDLQHYTKYKLTMQTKSCGSSSTPVPLNCKTGITYPHISKEYNSLVKVTKEVHNMFTLEINPSLFKSTEGPITHYGVLVTHIIKGGFELFLLLNCIRSAQASVLHFDIRHFF
ncbi:Receptor-type tyrosine-protein phosphatase eta [Merluccius polli]|uniref:Receptor-type tyrosine-protein phosphatase eta n=1 Tax=Merluccius polli TaxID=89951 RepID=A0AA47NWA6_MERPO|nr:Receptor-type tyrosine-protein phosphatase eta [Merluccius polli]